MTLMACVTVIRGNEPGSYFLYDLQEPCWEGRHLTWVVTVALPQVLLYGAGLPVAGALALFAERKHLYSGPDGDQKRHARVARRYGILYLVSEGEVARAAVLSERIRAAWDVRKDV